MKKILMTLALTLSSSLVMAKSISFTCADNNGQVKLSGRGEATKAGSDPLNSYYDVNMVLSGAMLLSSDVINVDNTLITGKLTISRNYKLAGISTLELEKESRGSHLFIKFEDTKKEPWTDQFSALLVETNGNKSLDVPQLDCKIDLSFL